MNETTNRKLADEADELFRLWNPLQPGAVANWFIDNHDTITAALKAMDALPKVMEHLEAICFMAANVNSPSLRLDEIHANARAALATLSHDNRQGAGGLLDNNQDMGEGDIAP